MTPPTRRRYLALAAGAAGLAGCGAFESSDESGEGTATYPGTSGPDERATARPPGEPALAPRGRWPQPGFDAGNTAYRADGSGLDGAERYWRLDAGGTPVVADGGLYNVYSRGVGTKRLTRRDPATAAVRASTDLVDHGVTDPPAVGAHAYVSTFTRPFAIEREGGVAWEGPTVDGADAPPTVGDDRVYVAGRGFSGRETPPKLVALTADGQTAWDVEFDRETVGSPATDGDRVVVATDAAVIDFDDGTERWRYEAAEPVGTPALSDDTVFVPGREAVHAVDAADGTEVWRAGVGNASLVVAGDRVVAGNGDRTVALDAALAEVAWERSGGGRPRAGLGETVYVTDRGSLTALELGDGDRRWRYETPEVQVADVVSRHVDGVTPLGGAVYVSAADGLHGLGPA